VAWGEEVVTGGILAVRSSKSDACVCGGGRSGDELYGTISSKVQHGVTDFACREARDSTFLAVVSHFLSDERFVGD